MVECRRVRVAERVVARDATKGLLLEAGRKVVALKALTKVRLRVHRNIQRERNENRSIQKLSLMKRVQSLKLMCVG